MKVQISAGGVVYKKDKDGIKILVGKHSGHHGWVFPKGLIGDNIKGESKEATAIREVKEETGIVGEIEKSLKPETYWYIWEGDKIQKTVYYFVMRYLSGDVENHDWEMEEVEWIPASEVAERLTYDSDKKVWKKASELIK